MAPESLRVAFGATVLARGLCGDGVDGIGSVARDLLAHLREHPDIAVTPFEYGRAPSGAIPGARPAGRFGRQALQALVTGRAFPALERSLAGDCDLIHAPDHLIPRSRHTPVVATIHDTIPLAHPEWLGYRLPRLKNRLWQRSTHWAHHVITISESSRRDIVHYLGIEPDRISVMPQGVDARWFVQPDTQQRRAVLHRYALPDEYFLFVGTLQPRKNIALLLRAFHNLPVHEQRRCPLVLVGRYGWGCPELHDALRAGRYPNVHWLQYVPDHDLPVLTHAATALLFSSLYEGFGLPIVEAFAAATPVVASNASSIPEVAGDAALLIDPADRDAWSHAMHRVLHDVRLREELRQRGRERAQRFQWPTAIEHLHAIYTRVIRDHN